MTVLSKKNNPLKLVLIALMLLLIAIGLVYAGTKINKKQTPPLSPSPIPTLVPSPIVENVKKTTGTITGRLCYPSDFLPPGDIVAKNILTKELIRQEYIGTTRGGATTYLLELSPGKYYLRYEAHASLKKPEIFTSGYYTFCSVHLDQCAGDQNHDLLEVEIKPGETLSKIDLCDFYYGPNNEPEF